MVILDGQKGIFGVKKNGDDSTSGDYEAVDADGRPVDYKAKKKNERFQLTDEKTSVIDTATGKDVFRTVTGEYIAGRFGGYWIIDGTGSDDFKEVHDKIITSYFYALDDKFNVALGGMISSDFTARSTYMTVHKEI